MSTISIPASPDNMGEFLAMDVKTGKVLWRHRTRTPMLTAALTTAGGLAIVGDYDRYLYIHDAVTGKVLYQTRLPNAVDGFPITYAVHGRQYLAVSVSIGSGGGWATPALSLVPEKKRATNVNGLYVFRAAGVRDSLDEFLFLLAVKIDADVRPISSAVD